MKSLLSKKNWNRFLLYTLFLLSTFSIAGIEASVTLLYLVTLTHWGWTRSIGRMYHPLLWLILLYTFWAFFTGLLNEYDVNDLKGLQTHWRLLLPFLLMGALADVDEERLLWSYFFFVSLISIYGMVQYFTGIDLLRPEGQKMTTPFISGIAGQETVYHGKGNFSHHLTYGGYLLLSFPLFGALMFCRDWGPGARFLVAIMAVLVLLGIASSLGRSVWLGTAVTIAILMLRLSPKIMIALCMILLAATAYFYTKVSDPEFKNTKPTTQWEALEHRFISGFKMNANQDRLLMWETGLAAIEDHFWLGIGYGMDSEVMPQYRDAVISRTKHRFQNRASVGVHNIYLQTWVNYGVIGFVTYLGIFLGFLLQCILTLRRSIPYSYENSILWAGISGICGFMVAGFFENNFRDGEVQAMLLMLMGLCLHQVLKLESRIFKH